MMNKVEFRREKYFYQNILKIVDFIKLTPYNKKKVSEVKTYEE